MDFVTFETAKKLKEKGYPQVKQNTLAMYDELGKWYSMAETIDEVYSFEDFDEYDCVCPTISQVLEWLRKEKEIHITIEFFRFNGNTELWWTYTIRYINNDDTENIFEDCKRETYEEATLAGIEYVIDNLI